MELKERIVSVASELFFKNGIRSVTMNEVAEALGISKRTLYEHFDNKEVLLEQCIDEHTNENNRYLEQLETENLNPVVIMHRHFRHAVIRIKEYHPNFARELQKLHPNIWKRRIPEIIRERDEYTSKLVSEGIRQGYFREETDPEIATKLLFAHVDLLNDNAVFPLERYSRADLFRYIVTSFLRSMATEKGLKEIENLFYNNIHESYVSY